MSTSQRKLPIHALPLASPTLQSSLTRLELGPEPSSQRRSTTFKTDTRGVWARTYPLWTSWPLRITKEEVAEMGVDIENGGKVSAEDVLARWDPVDPVELETPKEGGGTGNGLQVLSSNHRQKLNPVLLGLSGKAVQDCLPHLDIGDADELCNGELKTTSKANGSDGSEEARKAMTDILSGRRVLASKETDDAGPTYAPWSTRYVGHQFGSWAGQLGDGRAVSLLETTSDQGGRMEIQLKGSGRTPFSRTADGLAVLRSGVREFLGCEAVAALGIPATRSLALLTLAPEDLVVVRENGPEPTSLLARLAPSFIRIGHFEAMNPSEQARNFSQIFFGGGWARGGMLDEADGEGPLGGQGNLEGLRDLVEFSKGIIGYTGDTKGWAKEVVRRNASMVAGWQVYGWMHGVLNTDNISVLGLTIDFGPYAFMDIWDEGHICNHSDPSGLYSYRRQPERVLFALDKLVQALAPLIGYEALHGPAPSGWSDGKTKDDVKEWKAKAEEEMKDWQDLFWDVEREGERQGWLKRFGLKTYKQSDNRDVIYDYLTLLHSHGVDFHASLRLLSSFDPTKAGEGKYARVFAANFIGECTINLPADQVDKAIDEVEGWLSVYAGRVTEDEKVQAWTAADGESGADGGWVAARKAAMEGVNPRFVLRQWVLEELIAQLEATGVEGIDEGRAKLGRVLDMAVNPFEPYPDDDITEEGQERARLCGLGNKDMLGFQCSCSS